uniref:Uncharacterized protein n=1 Tax=Cacopsylla melanoneura TaxID=428564 RepID=A0A8D8VLB8_9HEMI
MTVFKMEQDIRDVLELTLKDHLSLCGYYAAVADSPPMMIKKDEFLGKGVQYKPYDYTVHVAMACMCGITYLGPVIILTVSLCLEKMTGAYTRCLVGGVKVVEIFAGYLFMLMIFNLINTGSMTFFQFVVYQQPYGQFWLTFLLLNALGLSGIFFGFFTVSLTNSLTECAGVCIVASLAMYTFTGFVWPIEAATIWIIEPICKFIFPNTLCLKALLAILWKDAGLFSRQVLLGFGICGLHLVLYTSLIYVIIRVRKGF